MKQILKSILIFFLLSLFAISLTTCKKKELKICGLSKKDLKGYDEVSYTEFTMPSIIANCTYKKDIQFTQIWAKLLINHDSVYRNFYFDCDLNQNFVFDPPIDYGKESII